MYTFSVTSCQTAGRRLGGAASVVPAPAPLAFALEAAAALFDLPPSSP
jgi:hypothetical protein